MEKYYCPNCKGIYSEKLITYNGWVSKWCPDCFRLGESPFDCELEIYAQGGSN